MTDPSHWAVVLFEDTVLTDAETGELVDEDSVDWDTEGDSQATPDEGLRHANTVTETTMFVADYFCLDYRAAGLQPESYFAQRSGLVATETGHAVDLDGEAGEAARQQAEADRAEAEKRERRKVLALNRLGDAALVGVGFHSTWRMAISLAAGLQNSHQNGGALFLIFVADPITVRWSIDAPANKPTKAVVAAPRVWKLDGLGTAGLVCLVVGLGFSEM